MTQTTRRYPVRSALFLGIVVLLGFGLTNALRPLLMNYSYELGTAAALLPEINESAASKLKFDKTKRVFNFDASITASKHASLINASQATAVIPEDAGQGLVVSDPVNKVDFRLTPKFDTETGKRSGNRIIYPLTSGQGWVVYTVQAAGVKEDIVLTHATRDSMTFDYELGLGEGQTARLESDGSIGIYGNSLFSGQISVGTEKDAELLKKARQHAEKNLLLFRIPKPTTIETGDPVTSLKTAYELQGDALSVTVSGLRAGHYPLSIDPSIYVASAEEFMLGNNESNITFDVENSLIKKGRTTGARFDSWQVTANLPNAIWGGGAVASGGYLYSIGGASFSGQVYSTQGADSFTVPSGVTDITVKVWGGGGGGGSGGTNSAGGDGGGSGYVLATIPTTPGETLTTYIGGGGGAGPKNQSSGGGGGGGFSSIYRGSTPLVIAGGGGGGGGGNRNGSGQFGGAGGAGGGTTGVSGQTVGGAGGGGGGTQSAGGSAGSGGQCPGTAGSSLSGGNGGTNLLFCTNGNGGDGGLTGGGAGGNWLSFFGFYSGGGGGGSGYFGGGGGSSSDSGTGSGGGGGGSSYTAGGLSSVTNSAGSGSAPGNSGDVFRGTAGNGGAGGGINGTGSAGSIGKIIISYSGTGSPATKSVNWAKFNTGSGTVDSANPGNGACSGWCSNTDYDLPAARANYSLVAYNGFLYAMGGIDDTVGLPRQDTVFIAKLGVNGEPRKWHPTNTNPATWDYWYQDTDLPSVLAHAGAVAYKDHMYLIGGLSTHTTNGTNTVRVADILPNGKLGSWSSTTALPSNLYGHTAQVYNDRLYVIGGATAVGNAPLNTVYYADIDSDGSVGSWVQTASFSGGRLSGGGSMAVVWGGYLYVSGGCGTVNASGHCTNVLGDTQVASINADGSLDKWNTIAGVSNQRMGFGMVAWRDNIYEVGGCSSQNVTTGDCLSGIQAGIDYGHINQDGDASTVGQSVTSGTAPCNGAVPANCDLPPSINIGNLMNTSIIANGYLYVIGGCTNNNCTTVSQAVVYAAVSTDGTLTQPATCPGGTTVGTMWCRSPNTIGGAVAGSSPVVFNGRLYLVGGFTGSALTGNIYRTTLNADGSISAWTAQTMAGAGATSVSLAYAFARANPANAATNPGNLYIFGGCTTSGSGANCTTFTGAVYKCNIATSGAIAGCSTSGQLQIGTVSGASGAGLGVMSGTVYANYVYLIGGSAPGVASLATVRYAKIDNNNNIVTAGSGWVQSGEQLSTARRYASAFGYNGYIYVIGGYDSGVVNDIEFAKINVSDGSLDDSGFKTSSVTINQRWGLTVPVSNAYAYVIGGCTTGTAPTGCTARTNTVQTFQLYNNNSGAPESYSNAANMYGTNTSRIGAGSAILNGYIYIVGGCVSATDCTNATNNVSYAPLNDYGQVGAWTSSGTTLPADRAWGKLLAAGGTLYYVGGQSDTASDKRAEVYYGTPAGSGNVASWGTATNSLPAARSNFGAAVWNDRLYVVGGEGTGTGCSGGVCNTVYVSPQLSSGGNITSAWSTSSTSFNIPRSGVAAVAYANNLYIFGGFDGTNYLSDSQYAKLSTSDGTAGSWTYSTSLPKPLAQSSAFGANGYIYLIGGRSAATTCDPVTLVAPVSANTAISSGNNPTGIGTWNEANQRFADNRYGAAAVYSDGKAYVLGGGCGATLTYSVANRVQQTVLLAQPQIAQYSILIDTDSDVFPSHWLINGLDNSIGARWQLDYLSMTNPGAATQCAASGVMSNYGQKTHFSEVSLGVPGTYTPKDSAGTNTNCARYYKFNLAIDSSRSYGYPDDLTQGPTLTDLTLQFTADPSKRLMHGRTFTGGLQQPVDTPYYAH